MDEEGYVYFSARSDDVIIMAGYRIGPVEVESVIASHVRSTNAPWSLSLTRFAGRSWWRLWRRELASSPRTI